MAFLSHDTHKRALIINTLILVARMSALLLGGQARSQLRHLPSGMFTDKLYPLSKFEFGIAVIFCAHLTTHKLYEEKSPKNAQSQQPRRSLLDRIPRQQPWNEVGQDE